jgi:GTP-binding protein HflX
VLNKQDLTGLPPAVERDEYDRIVRVRVSAKCGDGMSLLRDALTEIALEKLRILRAPATGGDASLTTDSNLDPEFSL